MRIRNHIRSNVVGYVALFFAISGSAVALDGSNTVFSDDIVASEVRRTDLEAGAVTGPKLDDDAVSNAKLADDAVGNAELTDASVTGAEVLDASVANADLADGSVGTNKIQDGSVNSAKVLDDSLGAGDLATNAVAQAEIATDGVAATEVQNDSIDAGEVVDFGLTNQDVGVLFAEVTSTAALSNSSGSVTATRVGAAGAGQYEVDFARNVNLCTAVATIGGATTGTALGEVNVADRAGNTEAVFVDTNNSDGTPADKAFRLVVVC